MRHGLPLLFLLLWSACANQGFPPGGPEDRTPPRVISAFPSPDSTGVGRTVSVRLLFSEPVQPFTAEKSIFITPFVGDRVRYKWKGDRLLTIRFADSLLADRTYTVTVGAGVKDRRNNMMKESYTLAFSTGERLDRGEINGTVYGSDVAGTQIWAYDLSQTPEPDPAAVYPLYVTQAGKDGSYRFTNMAFGRYRLFAVMDRNFNSRYNAGFDFLGVAHRDVDLSDDRPADGPLNFRIAQRDTAAPRLESASAPDHRHVVLRFSKAMKAADLEDPLSYLIAAEAETLQVLDALLEPQNRNTVQLATTPQSADVLYSVHVLRGQAENGSALDASNAQGSFTGSAAADTVRPRLMEVVPPDSARLVPLKQHIELRFSEAMNADPILRLLTLSDSAGASVSGTVSRSGLSRFRFSPRTPLKGKTLYVFTLPTDSVTDISGNALSDSLIRKAFITLNPDTLSGISGQMSDADSSASGAFFIRAASVNEKTSYIVDLRVEHPGRFEFSDLLPGKYVLELFRDQDGSNDYTWGEAFPFRPAERFIVYPDTVEIRSRWPTEGEMLILPR